jgi:hypothetical protein
MNRVIVSAFVVLLLASSPCLAQQGLVGTYKMVGVHRVFDGTPEPQSAKPPHGYLIITPTVFVEFFTDGGRTYGVSDKDKAALWDSLTAYSGSYRLEGNKIVVSVDTSWNEAYNGTQQTRDWQIQGNRLILSSGPRPWGRDPSRRVVVRLEWEKME